MSERGDSQFEPVARSFEREARDVIFKSSFTGVAATVMAVTIFSPAGLGGMIGTSLASSFGFNSGSESNNDVYANLPAYPSPLSVAELSDIRGQLASTAASLEITRAATEAKIEHVRAIAMSDGVVTYAPMRHAVEVAPVVMAAVEPIPAPAPVAAIPVNYAVGGGVEMTPYRDPHLELADLLLAHESF